VFKLSRWGYREYYMRNSIIYSKMTLNEISAVEEVMRMAVTGQQHVDGLVGYYRSNIDNYNN
jgi:hypothetical protein